MRNDEYLLADILDAALLINEFIGHMTFSSFEKDKKTSIAVVKELEIIGEASSRLGQNTRELNQSIPWEKIIGMRNRLVHHYFGVDYQIVWDTVKLFLPDFIAQIKDIQARLAAAQAVIEDKRAKK